jgi:hypothetical protein
MKAKPVLSGAEAQQTTKLISLAHNKEGKKEKAEAYSEPEEEAGLADG